LEPRRIIRLCVFLLALLVLASCSVTRKLPEGQYLLKKSTIKIDNRKILKDDLSGYIQQTPNKKFLGVFRPNIMLYQWSLKGDETKFKRWVRKAFGSPPVIADSMMAMSSARQMKLFAINKGYFHAKTAVSIKKKRRKASILYRVEAGRPYTIKHLNFSVADTHLARYFYIDTALCLIRRGNNYDAYTFDDERTRITTALKEHGFYNFSEEYISYSIDSSLNSYQVNVTLRLMNPAYLASDGSGKMIESRHKRFYLNNLYIFTDYNILLPDIIKYDTLVKTFRQSPKSPPSTYHFLYQRRFRIKPNIIGQSIFLTNNQPVTLRDVKQSYRQLTGHPIFKYVNISLNETRTDTSRVSTKGYLDGKIHLAKSQLQSFGVEADGTNSGGAFGVQGNLYYQNRNIFRGAQVLKLNLTGKLQMQPSSGVGDKNVYLFFNAIELGANANLTFPQFLLPIRAERVSKYFKPKTQLNLGYSYQRMEHFTRHLSNISFGYSWLQGDVITHTLNPAEILMVKIFTDSAFDAQLDNLKDTRLKNQYTNHLVAGLRYTFTFNNQNIANLRNFFYLRANLETGGNLLYGFDHLIGAPKTADGSFTLLNIRYAQYVRPEVDFRFYQLIGKNTSMVYRIYGGTGIPYGNSNVLPYEKAFSSGGANGMRGWRMRTLGPGSYANDSISLIFGTVGDIQMEANLEYRFPIYWYFKGALFVDIGNMWMMRSSTDFPGGEFKFSRFYKELGIDVGFGIRFDIGFFLFRIDPAISLHKPSLPEGERWRFSKWQLKDVVWNFGIGYPF